MSFVDLNHTDIYTGSPSLPQNIQGSVMSNLLWDRIHLRFSPESEPGRFVPSTVHLVQTIGMIILQTQELGQRLCPPRGTQPKMCCSPDSPERRQFILQGKTSRFTNQLTGILQEPYSTDTTFPIPGKHACPCLGFPISYTDFLPTVFSCQIHCITLCPPSQGFKSLCPISL